jgi:hypothetical protein
MRPYTNDIILGPSWLRLVSAGFSCLAYLISHPDSDDPEAQAQAREYGAVTYPMLLWEFWQAGFEAMFRGGVKKAVVDHAAEAFARVLRECLTEDMPATTLRVLRVAAKKGRESVRDPLFLIVESLKDALKSLHYRESLGAVLMVVEAVIEVCFAVFNLHGGRFFFNNVKICYASYIHSVLAMTILFWLMSSSAY